MVLCKCDYCNEEIQPTKIGIETGGLKRINKKNIPIPFNCKRCGGNFCVKHRLPENHNCNGREFENGKFVGFKPIHIEEQKIEDFEITIDEEIKENELVKPIHTPKMPSQTCKENLLFETNKKDKSFYSTIKQFIHKIFHKHIWQKVGGPDKIGTGKFKQRYKCEICNKYKEIID